MIEKDSEVLRRTDPLHHFPVPEIYLPGYTNFFQKILNDFYSSSSIDDKAEKLKEQLNRFVEELDLDVFPLAGKLTILRYMRVWLGMEPLEEKSGLEWLLARWAINNPTAIHGHPSFALYRVIRGSVRMRFFDIVDDEQGLVKERETVTLKAGDSIWKYDNSCPKNANLIHEVTPLEHDSLSTMIYSGDTKQGRIFSEVS